MIVGRALARVASRYAAVPRLTVCRRSASGRPPLAWRVPLLTDVHGALPGDRGGSEEVPTALAEPSLLEQRVVDGLRSGDIDEVRRLLEDTPDLNSLRGYYVHQVLDALDRIDDLDTMRQLVQRCYRVSSNEYAVLIAAELARDQHDEALESLKMAIRRGKSIDGKFVSAIVAAVSTSLSEAPEESKLLKLLREQDANLPQAYFIHRLMDLLRTPDSEIVDRYFRGMRAVGVGLGPEILVQATLGFGHAGDIETTEHYHSEFVAAGFRPDIRIYRVLTQCLALAPDPNIGKIQDLFESLRAMGYGPDQTMVNNLMHAALRAGNFDLCLQHFDQQVAVSRANASTFVTGLRACGLSGRRDRIWDMLMDYHERYYDRSHADSKVFAAAAGAYSMLWDPNAVAYVLNWMSQQSLPITDKVAMGILAPHFNGSLGPNARHLSHKLGMSQHGGGRSPNENTERVLRYADVDDLRRFLRAMLRKMKGRPPGPPQPTARPPTPTAEDAGGYEEGDTGGRTPPPPPPPEESRSYAEENRRSGPRRSAKDVVQSMMKAGAATPATTPRPAEPTPSRTPVPTSAGRRSDARPDSRPDAVAASPPWDSRLASSAQAAPRVQSRSPHRQDQPRESTTGSSQPRVMPGVKQASNTPDRPDGQQPADFAPDPRLPQSVASQESAGAGHGSWPTDAAGGQPGVSAPGAEHAADATSGSTAARSAAEPSDFAAANTVTRAAPAEESGEFGEAPARPPASADGAAPASPGASAENAAERGSEPAGSVRRPVDNRVVRAVAKHVVRIQERLASLNRSLASARASLSPSKPQEPPRPQDPRSHP